MLKKTVKVSVDKAHLTHILTNHVYSDDYAAIREFLANAHDATRGIPDPEIAVWGEGNKLHFQDNGCGMTEFVLENHYAGIARHYSHFEGEGGIGVFGIGVLSAFTVADRLTVETRSEEEPHGWRLEWKRDEGTFTIEAIDRSQRGTRATLHLTPDQEELAQEDVLEDYIANTFALFPVPISLGAGKPPINVHNAWLKSLDDGSETARLVMDGEGLDLFGKFIPGIDLLAACWIRGEDGSRIMLAIPSREQVRLDLHQVAFFSKGIFIHGKMRQVLPENLSFVVALIDSPAFQLQIDREGFRRDEAFKAVKESLEGQVLSFLELLSTTRPEVLRAALRAHRAMLLGHWKAMDRERAGVLRSLFRNAYRFKTTAGEHVWSDLLPYAQAPHGDPDSSERVIYTQSSVASVSLPDLITKANQEGAVIVFASGAELVLLEEIARGDGVKTEPFGYELGNPKTVPGPFKRLGAMLAGPLMSKGVGGVVFANLPGNGFVPAMFRATESYSGPASNGRGGGSIRIDALVLNVAHPLIMELASTELDPEKVQTAADVLAHIAELHLPFNEATSDTRPELIASMSRLLHLELGLQPEASTPVNGHARCFVAFPYAEEFSPVWEATRDLFQSSPYHWEVIRADHHMNGGDLFASMRDNIRMGSRFIADISGLNPNVLIELGMMLQQAPEGVLIMCDDETYSSVPTDLKGKVLLRYRGALRQSPAELRSELECGIRSFRRFTALQGHPVTA